MSAAQIRWEPQKLDFREDRELYLRSREVFYGARHEDYVDWLYGQNPAGPAYCTLALDGDRIAGQYIIIPIRLSMKGQEVKACLSLDTFTHQDYRRQGIFTALAERTYKDAEADGVRFTVGLPNENSRPGFLKSLKFTEPFDVRQSVLVLPARRLGGPTVARLMGQALFHGAAPLQLGLRFETPESLDVAWGDALWQRIPHARTWDLWKDGTWMRWRYCDNPRDRYRFITAQDRSGQPVGLAVWREDPHPREGSVGAWLMDLEGTGPGVKLALVRHLVMEVAHKVDYIKAMNLPASPQGQVLLACGFIPYRRVSFILRPHGTGLDGLPEMTSRNGSVSSAFTDYL